MPSFNADSNPVRPRPLACWLPWLAAAAAFAPLAWCWTDFRALFWFGDEWDQLDLISQLGFGRWVLGCFGENFAPAFKTTWGGLALASGGSYFVMIVGVWCVHAACVFLLGRWMLRAGFGILGTAVTLAVFGLAASNIEALGWTIQLITIQGIVFYLAAAQWHHTRESAGRWTLAGLAGLFLLVSLSTFSFVRGALSGGSLAIATLAPVLFRRDSRLKPRLLVAALCLVPAIVSVVVIMKFAPGNHQHLASVHWSVPTLYAASYFLLNPFYKLVADGMWTPLGLAGFGLFKVVVLLLGWSKAAPVQRRLLLPLIAFDVGNALLMGVGRYNEPIITATSSRYQYISLLCTLPFLAVVLEWLWTRVPSIGSFRPAVATVLLGAVTLTAVWTWPRDMRFWAEYRGRNTRRVLFEDPNPPAEGAIPGIPFLKTSRARELVTRYHLH